MVRTAVALQAHVPAHPARAMELEWAALVVALASVHKRTQTLFTCENAVACLDLLDMNEMTSSIALCGYCYVCVLRCLYLRLLVC